MFLFEFSSFSLSRTAFKSLLAGLFFINNESIMPFKSNLHAEQLSGNAWILARGFGYMSENTDTLVFVPAGFVTDFASIPDTLVSVFGRPSGEIAQPAVLHDFMCSKRDIYSRKYADAMFLEALADANIGWLKRHAMYLAVRLFGK